MDIDFTFAAPLDPRTAVNGLLEAGVSVNYEGLLSYVLDRDGMFDWKRVDISRLADVLDWASSCEFGGATFGISIIFDGDRGGDLLFLPERKELSFLVTINRKTLTPLSKFCDFGWYLRRLVPVLEPMGLAEIELRDAA
ncbi:hypothetical protein ACGF4C_20545 [Streptomyces sp. NPDC048197]|uniref:hypothetical protein n=1 Tax=Streptomyces sp. NPDC048197 TaxID=3365511 RepID=UPI003716B906